MRPVQIHILSHGLAVCRFSNEIPSRWDFGNIWMRAEELLPTARACLDRSHPLHHPMPMEVCNGCLVATLLRNETPCEWCKEPIVADDCFNLPELAQRPPDAPPMLGEERCGQRCSCRGPVQLPRARSGRDRPATSLQKVRGDSRVVGMESATPGGAVTIEITEEGYYIALWFLGGRNEDWMGCLYRDAPDKPLRLRYRFRYYSDHRVWNGDDRKEWFTVDFAGKSDGESVKLVESLLRTLVAAGYLAPGERVQRLWIRGNAEAFFKVYKTAPFMHAKEGRDAQEYAQQQGWCTNCGKPPEECKKFPGCSS